MVEIEPIRLQILSPEKLILDTKCSKVGLPGSMGKFTVLKDHCALMSPLVSGSIVYAAGGQEAEIAVRSGFVEVKDNQVTACVEI